MKKILMIVAGSVFLFACNTDSGTDSASNSDSLIQNSAATAPATQSVTQGAAPASQSQPAGVTAVGMNPAHGEPGHRCDISVGAPLNSAPTQAAPTVNPVVTTPTLQTAPSTPPVESSSPTPAGMNPPHGAPGHDCAVAMGAPLPKK